MSNIVIAQIQAITNSLTRILGRVLVQDAAGNTMPAGDDPARAICVNDDKLWDSVVDTNNSSAVTLGAGASFTGTATDVTGVGSIAIHAKASHVSANPGLYAQFSSDGTNWDIAQSFFVPATTGAPFICVPMGQWFRVVFTNGATPQTYFRLQTILRQQSGMQTVMQGENLYGKSCVPFVGSSTANAAAYATISTFGNVDGVATTYNELLVNAHLAAFNGVNWDRKRFGNLFFDVQGASGATLITATAAKKHRLHSMVLSADTTGLVTINDGIGRFYITASIPVSVQWGTDGKLQTTANTALTATNAGGGNIACCGVYNDET